MADLRAGLLADMMVWTMVTRTVDASVAKTGAQKVDLLDSPLAVKMEQMMAGTTADCLAD